MTDGDASSRPGADTTDSVAGCVELVVDGDEMEAKILLCDPPGEGGYPFTAEELRSWLSARGVRFGLAGAEALERRLGQPSAKGPIPVASGRAPVDPVDDRLEFLFDTSSKRTPKELPDGKVDFREIGLSQNAVKDQPLVRRIPGRKGEPGMTVTGRAIPVREPARAALLAGEGTRIAEDGLTLQARIDGQIVYRQGMAVSVVPVFLVQGDVDFSTGNVDSVGSVEVRGFVRAGFTVRSSGNIEVFGGVEDCVLEAAGDVTVHGGVLGAQRGRIRAGGHVRALFLQNASVEAKGDVVVTDSVMHSSVSGREVMVVGRGILVGGVTRARMGVSVKVAGSEFATVTRLEFPEEDPKARIAELEREMREASQQAEKVHGIATVLDRRQKGSGDDPAGSELMSRLEATERQMEETAASLSREIDALRLSAKNRVWPEVRIGQAAFPGVHFHSPFGDLRIERPVGGEVYRLLEDGWHRVDGPAANQGGGTAQKR